MFHIKGHDGIRGNQVADRAAKKALDKKKFKNDFQSHAFFGPKTFNCQICIYQIWQKEWDKTVLVSDKFHEILPKLPDKLLSFLILGKKIPF